MKLSAIYNFTFLRLEGKLTLKTGSQLRNSLIFSSTGLKLVLPIFFVFAFLYFRTREVQKLLKL